MVKQRPEHLGTMRKWYGLKNEQSRAILLDFIAGHKDLSYEDWLTLIDALYHGDSYEERCAPRTLLRKFPRYRRQLPLARLDAWLGCLNGWAEVDSTCQTVFSDKDLLADWDGWSALFGSLGSDKNVNKRRAALVLLTAPISQSADARILDLSLKLIDRLKGEKDGRITKAISWLLRKGIKQHREAIAAYLEANAGTLPAIAVRETRRKLATGKK
jgi:3-methyladenine DNA glycosylase AlkD